MLKLVTVALLLAFVLIVALVPAGKSAGGLPIGLQIAAPHYAEGDLIQFGKRIEQLGLTFVPPYGY